MGNPGEKGIVIPESIANGNEPTFRRVADNVGTPAYVYFEKSLRDSIRTFTSIPAPFGLRIRYAMKANPAAAILRIFDSEGAHIDASTFNETRRAIEQAGIDGRKIRLTSQEVQSPDRLKYLNKKEVSYTACSLRQLDTYGQALPGTEVGVRFNIGIGSGWNAQTSTGGVSSSFGIYEQRDEIDALLKRHALTLTTVHLHIGSGSDPKKQEEAIKSGLALVRDYPSVTTLNMGGGFKVARMSHEKGTDIAAMGRAMSQALRDFEQETGRQISLEVEPGTALVANAGYIVTEITDKVHTGESGQEFLNVDGGMNVNARVSLYGAQHPLAVIPRNGDSKERGTRSYVVAGPCCESGDVLTVTPGKPDEISSRDLLEAEVGDLLVVAGAGAYGSSMSIANYNSLERPPEVLIRTDGTIAVIRDRQDPVTIWEHDKIPTGL